MTCAQARDRLDDYVDGGHDEDTFQALELHLAGCSACREEERQLRALIARAAALPRELSPGRDLWPGIAERLAAERRPTGWRTLVAALRTRPWLAPGLAAAAAATVALVALLPRVPQPQPGPVARAGVSPAPNLGAAEADYARAARELQAALEARRGTLPPETTAAVEQNLRLIDAALGDIRVALARDPDNPQLARLLHATNRRKVALLQQIVRLSTRL